MLLRWITRRLEQQVAAKKQEVNRLRWQTGRLRGEIERRQRLDCCAGEKSGK